MNKFKYYTAYIVVASFFLTFFSPTSVASASTDEPCLPAVLMLRGSGETPVPGEYFQNGEKIIDTGNETIDRGWEGEAISRLLTAFAEQTDTQKRPLK